ncbi:uncharacterized protein Tco025E_01199 [Trypanosoma conorhini]|uniref:URB1 C-terminal domain-containing protein n=1 Tax=Trypanosoma conorhini TaxID=83891 RepID=A0A3R7PK18_9TRYP|nr:uncharacterized protein Tco025E_01199 [Trypanosoma conorhini]RNF26494.1 hypothetical protein Tco025E_01199 [Trypanosoma conorhini]
MAQVEPLVGYLLSKYADTVTEGLEKIRRQAQTDRAFAAAFLLHPQGLVALQEVLQKRELCAPALQTVTQLVEACDNAGVRSSALREMCRGKAFWVLRRGLASLSDAMLPVTMAALQFLAVVASSLPKLVLSRFGNTVPLQLSCFRLQLPYSQRRIRMARVQFLLNLVATPHAGTVEIVVCAHGFLTHLLEDAAELLQEGTETGVSLARAALRVFGEHFMEGRMPSARKRAVLLAQKNIVRLLVKALDHALVAEYAFGILCRIVVELVESPCDYHVMRLEAEDRGMPNYLLFFILRQLRPKSSPASARLAIFILHQAPDLIRPFFTRVSSHLGDDGGAARISATTAAVATLNTMTRAMLTPIPYHLAAGKARLETVEARATTFFAMSSEHVAEEICPAWVAEYVHRHINGSSDLLLLAFAIQLTCAILTRAKAIQHLVAKLQDAQSEEEKDEGSRSEWDTFDAKVQAALLKVIPRREEFWHRMTQQLHPMMYPASNAKGEAKQGPAEKVVFLSQRMLLLMELYADVFQLRMSWLSAVPSFLPTFRTCAHPIEDALRRGEGALTSWPAPSISALCSLLVSALSQGVSMTKLHHVTMSSTKKGVLEWPLLLSVMLWAVRHRNPDGEEGQLAWAWVARLMQWTVHSVTVRFVCELEEAFVWLATMDESTLPCFVHLINYLLQRSLSKSADRIAQELMQGDAGIIVCAARSFAAKAEEKSTSGDVGAVAEKGAGKQRRGNKMPRHEHADEAEAGGAAGGGSDLWTTDLREHVAAFKKVTERVARAWPDRGARMKEALPIVFASARTNESGKRRIALTMLQAEKEHRSLRPIHDQLLEFCRTLRPPVPATDAEEEAALLSTARRGDVAALLRQLDGGGGPRPSEWCKFPTLGWELAGLLLRRLNELGGSRLDEVESVGEAYLSLLACGHSLLESVANDATAVAQVLLDRRLNEANTVGFLLLLLAATRILLHGQAQPAPLTSAAHARLEDATVTALARLLLCTYSGTVSAMDRVRYTTLLTLSYLQQQEQRGAGAQRHGGAEETPRDVEAEDEDAAGRREEEDAPLVASRRTTTLRVFGGMLVPHVIMDQRFLIMNHQSSPHVAPEVDMLSLLVDMWTEEEVAAAALQCPARLHNTLLVNAKVDLGWEVLRSLFPEFSAQGDVPLASFDALTAATVMDPRYLAPLLHVVLAMPAEQLPRKNIGTKCIPFLLRSLSFTDPQLRRLGATALSAVWTPSGPTRIVVGFARLKLTQLAGKRGRSTRCPHPHPQQQQQQQQQQRGGGEIAWDCPRLPAPVSAFLVMALQPLANAGYPLHNDIMRFLMETQEALANPVPLHRFLTSFPLACITTPLMIKRQEAAQSMTKSHIAAASAEELVQELKSGAPIHLEFIVRLIQFGCATNGDMMALLRSESLQTMMLLASMLAASAEIRLQLLRCLHFACTTSSDVAKQALEEGHVLSWLLGFAAQLLREYGGCVHMYGEPLFMEVVTLLRKLSPLSRASPLQARQVRQQLELLRDGLLANRVTTRDVLDGVEGVLRGMRGEEGAAAAAGTAPPRKRRAPHNSWRPAQRIKQR